MFVTKRYQVGKIIHIFSVITKFSSWYDMVNTVSRLKAYLTLIIVSLKGFLSLGFPIITPDLASNTALPIRIIFAGHIFLSRFMDSLIVYIFIKGQSFTSDNLLDNTEADSKAFNQWLRSVLGIDFFNRFYHFLLSCFKKWGIYSGFPFTVRRTKLFSFAASVNYLWLKFSATNRTRYLFEFSGFIPARWRTKLKSTLTNIRWINQSPKRIAAIFTDKFNRFLGSFLARIRMTAFAYSVIISTTPTTILISFSVAFKRLFAILTNEAIHLTLPVVSALNEVCGATVQGIRVCQRGINSLKPIDIIPLFALFSKGPLPRFRGRKMMILEAA